MTQPRTAALIALVIAVAAAVLYTRGLDAVPPSLIHDEAQGALHARAIAMTGRDQEGRLLPMYFSEAGFAAGRDPLMIYVTALGLKLLPFTDAGVRTPTALVAVVNIVLMFFAARAIFQSTWAGVLAAVMLAMTPIHFIRGRLLLSPLYSVPFVLAWLWALQRFELDPSTRRLAVACVWLALGMYSYLGAVVMMTVYLLMTLAVAARPLRWRGVIIAAAVFTLCLLPMALWYVTHPDRNAQIVSAYQLGAGTSWVSLIGNRIGLYWTFFDPSYLFISGDASMINSTRTAGLFPWVFAVLLPLGLWSAARSRQPIAMVIAAGFLSAPLVTVISGAIEMNRVMFAIPFAVLVATYGAVALWLHRSIAGKLAAAVLLAAIMWQFASFHRSYMSDGYRIGAAGWFSGHSRDALRALMARSHDVDVYVSQDIEWAEPTWRFYALEAGREDLVRRTTYFTDPPQAAAGARLICPIESARCAAIAASGSWHELVRVPSLDGGRHFAIFERRPGANPGG